MGAEESESFRCKLVVTLSSETPVVGIEINPHVFVHKLAPLSIPELILSFSWLRNQNKSAPSRYGIDYSDNTEEENESIGIGNLKSYVPTLYDLGSTLSLVCVAVDPSSNTHLSEASIVTTCPVITPPVSRPRRVIECSPSTSNLGLGCDSDTGPTFSVLTYNVLADLYTRLGGGMRYGFCPKWARVWEYRRELLLREILGYNADIICLQEVQSDHFEDFFGPELTNYGYSVLYKKKPSKDYMAHGLVSDGCATFYRSNLFKEIIKHELEFGKITMQYLGVLGHDDETSRRLCKDNVALVVVLEILDNKDSSLAQICVVNTHISADSDFPVIKLFQVVSLVNELVEKFDPEIPILICGDFNSRPTSDPHAYIVTGKCNPNYEAKQDPFRIVNHLNLHHSLPLGSAYGSFPVPVGDEEGSSKISTEMNEPIFTYMSARSSGTLDYIFYTENNLRVEHLLDLLDPKSLRGLPSPYWPSDHIALMAGFRVLH